MHALEVSFHAGQASEIVGPANKHLSRALDGSRSAALRAFDQQVLFLLHTALCFAVIRPALG